MHLCADKYRTAAKQAAWYSEHDDANPNYNPFRKTRRRLEEPGQAHEDNGLQAPPTNFSQTEAAAQRSSRHDEKREEEKNGKHPNRSETMPYSSEIDRQSVILRSTAHRRRIKPATF